ncbi:MAG: multiheme c-type cytochrome [Candidatus Bipolaricaulia bacterium]
MVVILLLAVIGWGGTQIQWGARGSNAAAASGDACIECHSEVTPALVQDFQQGKMGKAGLSCATCHGSEHTSADDVAEAKLPTPETCATCHPGRVEQFKAGKHALAWTAMNAMPATHYQPMELIAGKKGCGGCHKIGLKTEEEMAELRAQGYHYGVASCDSCHTRHTFSAEEARQPEACATCHMGFDHPQWEMWSTSKHGVRYQLKREGVLPEGAAAPTCQTCHMPDGNHEVRTAWGFLAVRLPLPEDEQWKADRTTILKALGVLNPETGEPTERFDAVKAADVARLTEEAWQTERQAMLQTCSRCHSEDFAKGELEKGDEMIRQADHLLAEAIRIVAGLYQDGILTKPEGYEFAYPDLLTFHEAGTPIEQRLFKMFLKHRMRAFQGAFHANPDYAFWYGWAELRSDLTEIRAMAEELRERAGQ